MMALFLAPNVNFTLQLRPDKSVVSFLYAKLELIHSF